MSLRLRLLSEDQCRMPYAVCRIVPSYLNTEFCCVMLCYVVLCCVILHKAELFRFEGILWVQLNAFALICGSVHVTCSCVSVS